MGSSYTNVAIGSHTIHFNDKSEIIDIKSYPIEPEDAPQYEFTIYNREDYPFLYQINASSFNGNVDPAFVSLSLSAVEIKEVETYQGKDKSGNEIYVVGYADNKYTFDVIKGGTYITNGITRDEIDYLNSEPVTKEYVNYLPLSETNMLRAINGKSLFANAILPANSNYTFKVTVNLYQEDLPVAIEDVEISCILKVNAVKYNGED